MLPLLLFISRRLSPSTILSCGYYFNSRRVSHQYFGAAATSSIAAAISVNTSTPPLLQSNSRRLSPSTLRPTLLHFNSRSLYPFQPFAASTQRSYHQHYRLFAARPIAAPLFFAASAQISPVTPLALSRHESTTIVLLDVFITALPPASILAATLLAASVPQHYSPPLCRYSPPLRAATTARFTF